MTDELRELLSTLELTMSPVKVLEHLRTHYAEEQIKTVLDGLPYCVDTDVTVDGHGNRERHGYDIRNFYDGNLMGRLLTTWTYWDVEKHIVKDMIIDDGIGTRQRTIVRRDEKGNPVTVEKSVVVEEARGLQGLVNRLLGRA